jgi:malate dehydrogenase (oxaloacetate-decarboxylating)
MRNAKPTVLIGVSGQAGAFTEQAVREMAKHTARPVIFPLSNPTSRSEATPQDLLNWTDGRALIGVTGQPGVFTEEMVRAMARAAERPMIFPLSNPTSRSEADPADIMRWTDGRALIGTGSPFPPVERSGKHVPVDQCNNSYIFPGVGLGVLAVRARRVTDSMFMAAAKALAEMSPAHHDREARLLPALTNIRAVSVAVATAVAKQACKEGLAEECEEATLGARIHANVWEPVYLPHELITEP